MGRGIRDLLRGRLSRIWFAAGEEEGGGAEDATGTWRWRSRIILTRPLRTTRSFRLDPTSAP